MLEKRSQSHAPKMLRLPFAPWIVVGALLTTQLAICPAQETFFVELSNGMRLGPGILSETDSISTNSFERGGTSGEVGGKSIGILDDGLRLTYYYQGQRNLLRVEASTAPPFVEIVLPSAAEAARSGNPPSIRAVLAISEFNKYGRRTVSFLTTRGRVNVLQGITLLTPTFSKLEIINWDGDKFPWDSRIATSEIPPQKLQEILRQAFDLSTSGDWLKMVSFYTQAERYSEARDIMDEALRKFPSELADRRPLVERLDQFIANQKFDEIKLRRAAGQQKLATGFLGAFPVQTLPLETQVKLEEEVKNIQQQLIVVGEVTEALKEHVAKLPEPDQQVVAPIVDELLNEVSLETIVRFADFRRLRTDDSIPNENKVALALSGWILGVGAGLDNFAVVKSLLRVRGLVKEYLDVAPEQRRQQILTQLRSEEGAQAQFLDMLFETMKPPQEGPSHQAADPPGLYRFEVNLGPGATVRYVAQLPPEYDPNRKYPCVLAVPRQGDLPEQEINWWCGAEMPIPSGEKVRTGQATRYGYIVVSPEWASATQIGYQYTEGEHARILGCLRDAFRKLSIDTDRVFIAGQADGATAAWDIALAHPDLWAGAIMISPGADKHIVQYSENVQGKPGEKLPLGTYIVYGHDDPTRLETQLGRAATRYLTSPLYDSLVVEYQGRGKEKFISELPRIMEWMELSSHRRARTPRSIEVTTMRPGDRFFYWLEAPEILPTVAGNPYQFNPAASGTFDAKLLDSSVNGVNISRIASANKRATIWLTPDMVDFSRPITIGMPGKRSRLDLAPDIGVMLEDVRTRGDRMHVFWQRVDLE